MMSEQRKTEPQRPAGEPAWPKAAVAGLCVASAVVVPLLAITVHPVVAAVAAPVLAVATFLAHRVALKAQRQASQAAASHLRTMTVQDELTGSNNMAGLQLLGNQMLQTVRRKGDAVHAFVVDTSHLTKDRVPLDRSTADQVMIAVASALKGSVRGTDVVARTDTSQFIIMGPGTGVHPGELERRVRSHLTDGPALPLDSWPCRITVGQASLAPWDGGDLDTLFDKAQQDFKMRQSMRSPSTPEAFFTGSNTPKPH